MNKKFTIAVVLFILVCSYALSVYITGLNAVAEANKKLCKERGGTIITVIIRTEEYDRVCIKPDSIIPLDKDNGL